MEKMLKLKICFSVIAADVLNHFAQIVHICRVFSVFHQHSDLIAENSAEILMSGEGEEASGIGQHTDEGGNQPCVGKGLYLLFHSGLVIAEPPRTAQLNFSADSLVIALVISCHGGQHIGVSWIQVV